MKHKSVMLGCSGKQKIPIDQPGRFILILFGKEQKKKKKEKEEGSKFNSYLTQKCINSLPNMN